jgi:hypothetical protein
MLGERDGCRRATLGERDGCRRVMLGERDGSRRVTTGERDGCRRVMFDDRAGSRRVVRRVLRVTAERLRDEPRRLAVALRDAGRRLLPDRCDFTLDARRELRDGGRVPARADSATPASRKPKATRTIEIRGRTLRFMAFLPVRSSRAVSSQLE